MRPKETWVATAAIFKKCGYIDTWWYLCKEKQKWWSDSQECRLHPIFSGWTTIFQPPYIFLMVYGEIALGFPIQSRDMMLHGVLCWTPNLTFLVVLGLQHCLSKVVKHLTHTFCVAVGRGIGVELLPSPHHLFDLNTTSDSRQTLINILPHRSRIITLYDCNS